MQEIDATTVLTVSIQLDLYGLIFKRVQLATFNVQYEFRLLTPSTLPNEGSSQIDQERRPKRHRRPDSVQTLGDARLQPHEYSPAQRA
jgi:hypothetical protein